MVEEDDSMAVDSSLSKKEKKEKKRKRDADGDDDEESPAKVCSSVPRLQITLTRRFRRKKLRRRGRPGKRPRKPKRQRLPLPQRRTGRHQRRRKSGSRRLRSNSVAFYIISTVHILLSCTIPLSSVQSWHLPIFGLSPRTRDSLRRLLDRTMNNGVIVESLCIPSHGKRVLAHNNCYRC